MKMTFDGETAELHYSISDSDMEFLKNYLPTNIDGQTVIKFKVVSRIIGSNSEGMLADVDALQSHEFSLILIDMTEV
jgi:hypothetical protein